MRVKDGLEIDNAVVAANGIVVLDGVVRVERLEVRVSLNGLRENGCVVVADIEVAVAEGPTEDTVEKREIGALIFLGEFAVGTKPILNGEDDVDVDDAIIDRNVCAVEVAADAVVGALAVSETEVEPALEVALAAVIKPVLGDDNGDLVTPVTVDPVGDKDDFVAVVVEVISDINVEMDEGAVDVSATAVSIPLYFVVAADSEDVDTVGGVDPVISARVAPVLIT